MILSDLPGSSSHCSRLSHSPSITLSEKILLFDYPWIDQTKVDLMIRNYSRVRNLHSKQASMEVAPLVILINMIAVAFNATLLSATGLSQNCTGNITTIALQIPSRELRLDSSRDQVETSLSPTIFPVTKSASNLVYCQNRRKKQENMSPLEIFRNTADTLVWMSLLLSILLISLLLKVGSTSDFSEILLTTLSILLSPAISGISRNSKLFVLWTFVCLLFLTYYSGSLTSVVISPPPDARFTKIDELYEHKYTLLSISKFSADWVILSVNEGLRWSQKKNTTSYRRFTMLKELFTSSILIPTDSDDETWYKKLWEAESKIFLFVYFATAVHTAGKLMVYLKNENIHGIRCYLGEELEVVEMTYFMATSSGRNQVARIYLLLLEAGYYSFLEKEFWALISFNRVQDRVRVDPSLTRIVEETQAPRPLQIWEGKLRNVFLLWVICLGGGLGMFVLEILKTFAHHAKLR